MLYPRTRKSPTFDQPRGTRREIQVDFERLGSEIVLLGLEEPKTPAGFLLSASVTVPFLADTTRDLRCSESRG